MQQAMDELFPVNKGEVRLLEVGAGTGLSGKLVGMISICPKCLLWSVKFLDKQLSQVLRVRTGLFWI